MTTKTLKTKFGTVTYEDTPKIRKAVFDQVLHFYVKHHAFSGASVSQRDAPQMGAVALLADLCDTFEFVENEE